MRFEPTYPTHLTLKDSHIGVYSSKWPDDEKETVGTQFHINHTWNWSRQGDGYRLSRRLDTLIARGYHKNSMPNELERKVGITIDFDSDMRPGQVAGYDTLHAVLKGIPQQKPEWKSQLLDLSDTIQLQKSQRDLWRLFGFMPKNTDLELHQKLDVSGLNQRLETFQADSAQFLGRQPRLGKSCLDLEVKYHRRDSLVLMREQFFNSTAAARKLRNARLDLADIKGIWVISVDRKTGMPCYWSQTEIGDLPVKDTAAHVDTTIQLIRFEEDVVQY